MTTMKNVGQSLVTVALVVFVLFWVWTAISNSNRADRENANNRDKAYHFDRICTNIQVPLALARDRLQTAGSAEAGRDIAVVIAPVVAQCTGLGIHQGRLEGLATSNDDAHDAKVIQGILDEIAKVERP